MRVQEISGKDVRMRGGVQGVQGCLGGVEGV